MILMLLVVAAATPAQPALKPACKDMRMHRLDSARRMRPQKLGEEPSATPIYAVLRTDAGCVRPMPVNRSR